MQVCNMYQGRVQGVVHMSRNDLIGVTRVGRRYYVLCPLNADTEWSSRATRRLVLRKQYVFRSRSRGQALMHAHDLQRFHTRTEYGVWEM
jgi:hypothetical protein